ncbi:MAG: GHKL domain-containing protein [Clostridia bacterium]
MIYPMSELSRTIPDVLFSVVGIWMAHAMFHSPRKRWQIIIAWSLAIIVCGILADILEAALPAFTQQRHSMFAGFSGIFVYVYIFYNQSIPQRVFIYFFVDCTMYLIILLARALQLMFCPYLPISPDGLFIGLYLVLLAAFCLVFSRIIKPIVQETVSAGSRSGTAMALYSAVSYITILLLFDVFADSPALSFFEGMKLILAVWVIFAGYTVSFLSMRYVARDVHTREENRRLSEQLQLSEQYYTRMTDQIQTTRVLNHDMCHHLNVIGALLSSGETTELANYLHHLGTQMKRTGAQQFCTVLELDALLVHYSEACAAADIAFSADCQVRRQDISARAGLPIKLCVILGNPLQNALEGALRATKEMERFLRVRIKQEENSLTIEVQNTCDEASLHEQDGSYVSAKRESGPGLGLLSVQRTLADLDGNMMLFHGQGTFVFRAVMKV